MSHLPKVAIVGRVNVGKSTLFNRLISQPKAITSQTAGTTRDRNYDTSHWQGIDFYLIDTGGLEVSPQSNINKQINSQIQLAMDEADLIILVVDAKSGVMPDDKNFAQLLQNLEKPIVLAVNKSDNLRLRQSLSEFYKLNLGTPHPVSATNGSGTGDLLDEVVSHLKNIKIKKAKSEKIRAIKIAIVGKPNVGKSSLINAILGQNRLITDSEPHTTRDAQDVEIIFNKQPIIFVDTAGWRRSLHKKPMNAFEILSVKQSINAIKKSDITILVTDASQKLSWQDKHLASEALESQSGLIILANKWDLIKNKTEKTSQEFTYYYKKFFPFLSWAPLLFTSSITRARLQTVLETAVLIYNEKNKIINDNALDKFLKKIIKRNKPNSFIQSLKQIKTNPPQFIVTIGFKAYLPDAYLRFIENNLRYKFGFIGTPLKIDIKKNAVNHRPG